MTNRSTSEATHRLVEVLSTVHDCCLKTERSLSAEINKVTPEYRASARNLAHYLGLRRNDLREIQKELASLGLSSLGRMESHTLAGLEAVLAALHKMGRRNETPPADPAPPVDFHTGPALLAKHAQALLGPEPSGRRVRIMVTMPSEAATEYELVRDLLAAGMDVMRINCAHDGPSSWQSMIENLRRAERQVRRPCKVLMDLAGPKLRTGHIAATHHVVRWKPRKDVRGIVAAPARLWLSAADRSSAPSPEHTFVPVDSTLVSRARQGDKILVKDTRGRKRTLHIIRKGKEGVEAESADGAYVEQGAPVRLRRAGRTILKSEIGALPEAEEPIVLREGDHLLLTADETPGSRVRKIAAIPCTLPQVFRQVRPGERIFFDDGKIQGVIERATRKQLEIVISGASKNGSKLRSDKGINLPDTKINLPALTEKDLEDLEFIVKHADAVGGSFVRKPEDVVSLANRIAELGGTKTGMILKIENRAAFDRLPPILLAGLRTPLLGVMVARGDLAVEVGFERLAEVQEEILWLCEAAHAPVVWATQVLESMAQKGKPSRAEVTDAAMSGRAECVMLNKGPHVVETVRFLDDVLRRMQRHQQKKRSMLRRLSISQVTPDGPGPKSSSSPEGDSCASIETPTRRKIA